ncbi:GcrA family cell cycle regulator [Rhizobium leguminosarum]|uniref:GcrA family cell cycle regulator n=1 Tax=Rhizobium leguminosarum TaxID=384 RepID=UPI0013B7B428|nr:GcrA family cell cycle regulator [Rhizobium leguminosarum]NEH72312.1 hypothetical protein [Rhizobium leguminosarum]
MSNYPEWSSLSKEQRIEMIRRLAASGLSSGLMANRFIGVSRNGIIGYCKRYGIKLGQGQPLPSKQVVRKETHQKKVVRRANDIPPSVIPHKPTNTAARPVPDIVALGPVAKSRAFDPIDGVAPVSLENLGAHRCHWPVNGFNGHEPIFCGATSPNLYCTPHARLAYLPR